MRRKRRFAAGVLLAACSVVAGCGAKTKPTTVVVLPQPVSGRDLAVDTRDVRLSVGQVVSVQVQHHDWAARWQQASAGSATVVEADGEDTIDSCPQGVTGCGALVQKRYKAVAAGTTTIEWDYVGMGPGAKAPSGVPAGRCPGFDAGETCPVGVMKIVVTVG